MKQIQSVFITKNNHIRAWKQLIGYVGRDEKDDNKQKCILTRVSAVVMQH